MPTKICRDCKQEFEVKSTYNSRYPKKYCDKCAKERREAYADIHNVSADDCEDE
jgi:hypothetical protein